MIYIFGSTFNDFIYFGSVVHVLAVKTQQGHSVVECIQKINIPKYQAKIFEDYHLMLHLMISYSIHNVKEACMGCTSTGSSSPRHVLDPVTKY